MKKYLIIIGLVLFLANCQNNKQEAQASLEKARGFYEKAEYGSAKQVLDEIKTNYPKITDLQEERLHLMRLIELKEQERNLNYCDSMLMIFQNEASRFPKENPTASDDSQPLRIGVNEDGGMYIISSYTGATPLHHNQLKISLVSGEYVETEA
ncbi:MAG: hypothetical protein LBN18_07920, partial [Dysgonamonadaceae bacterium]|nr:hypothetical protein [Dysgonamonadaceae bacterium]